ncbi:MAG TPA: DUF4870 domain-containing protein [Actinomycetota bacterium]|jgi:uncharacterized Tic20 family protein|nr:DUF4870 domain-containing protein [Actinomycetota bacterium]
MSEQVPPPPPPIPPAGPPGGGPPAGGPPPGGPPGQGPLPADQERLWAMLSHLLSFVAAYLFLGFVAPLIILLVFGQRSAFVRANAVESLNFNLSWLLYAIISVVLFVVGIGIFLLLGLGIAYVILIVIASIRANNGELYRYPLTIRLVR